MLERMAEHKKYRTQKARWAAGQYGHGRTDKRGEKAGTWDDAKVEFPVHAFYRFHIEVLDLRLAVAATFKVLTNILRYSRNPRSLNDR